MTTQRGSVAYILPRIRSVLTSRILDQLHACMSSSSPTVSSFSHTAQGRTSRNQALMACVTPKYTNRLS